LASSRMRESSRSACHSSSAEETICRVYGSAPGGRRLVAQRAVTGTALLCVEAVGRFLCVEWRGQAGNRQRAAPVGKGTLRQRTADGCPAPPDLQLARVRVIHARPPSCTLTKPPGRHTSTPLHAILERSCQGIAVRRSGRGSSAAKRPGVRLRPSTGKEYNDGKDEG
jgi:hypothetical protein